MLISEEEQTFFKAAADDELKSILTRLKLQLSECRHNLIEIQKQVLEYLNQIKYQSGVVEKLRQLKYLKDQFTIRATTDIDALVAKKDDVIFEANPSYPLKLSIEYLQIDNEAHLTIQKVAKKIKTVARIKLPMAGNISTEYLQPKTVEEIQVNLEEVRNNFLASGNNLFDFIMGYRFEKEISFEEKVTVYCQLISQYDNSFSITEKYNLKQDVEYAMVYPK